MTSTTTVSIAGPSGFIRCPFFRVAFFVAARFGLAAAAVRFAAFRRDELDTLRALPRAAELLLRAFGRFFDCVFLRLAMIDLPPAVYCNLESVCEHWR
jgi:hypothetical protein